MAPPVFKTGATRLRRVGWVRFPHAPATRVVALRAVADPFRMRLATHATLAVTLAGALAAARPAWAQRPDSARTRPDTLRVTPRADSARRGAPARPVDPVAFRVLPPISPRRAFLYSALVPGLGQTRLRRPNAGALFAFVELAAITMARKTWYDVEEARAFAPDSIVLEYVQSNGALTPQIAPNRYATRLRARRTHREDWIALIVFNHLVAGADAFVAAQLWDLPAEVSLRSDGTGGAVVASLRW